jgi:predicted membrane metal-binding protein
MSGNLSSIRPLSCDLANIFAVIFFLSTERFLSIQLQRNCLLLQTIHLSFPTESEEFVTRDYLTTLLINNSLHRVLHQVPETPSPTWHYYFNEKQ